MNFNYALAKVYRESGGGEELKNPAILYAMLADVCRNNFICKRKIKMLKRTDELIGLFAMIYEADGDTKRALGKYSKVKDVLSVAMYKSIVSAIGKVVQENGNCFLDDSDKEEKEEWQADTASNNIGIRATSIIRTEPQRRYISKNSATVAEEELAEDQPPVAKPKAPRKKKAPAPLEEEDEAPAPKTRKKKTTAQPEKDEGKVASSKPKSSRKSATKVVPATAKTLASPSEPFIIKIVGKAKTALKLVASKVKGAVKSSSNGNKQGSPKSLINRIGRMIAIVVILGIGAFVFLMLSLYEEEKNWAWIMGIVGGLIAYGSIVASDFIFDGGRFKSETLREAVYLLPSIAYIGIAWSIFDGYTPAHLTVFVCLNIFSILYQCFAALRLNDNVKAKWWKKIGIGTIVINVLSLLFGVFLYLVFKD